MILDAYGHTYSPRKTKAYRDLPVYTWTAWDQVSTVTSALQADEQGQFLAVAQMVDAIGRDDRLTGLRQTRVNSLLGCPVEFEAAGDKRRGAAVAAAAQEKWTQLFPVPALADLAWWGVMLGVGLAELVWYDRRGKFTATPRLKVWHPQFLQWRWDTRSYWVSTMDGLIEVTPGDGRWVLYAPHGEQRGWIYGLIRALAVPWLVRQFAVRDWARWSEVHGIPIRIAQTPAGAKEEDRERFRDEVSQLSTESIIECPATKDGNKFDVRLVEAMGDSWEGFERLIEHCNSSFAITVLGQNLTTEVKGGSYAAAKVQENVRQDVLEYDAQTLSECLREQALRPWAALNYGDEDLAPLQCWVTAPPEDDGENAKTLLALGQALVQLKNVKAPVDVEAVLEEYGVPMLETSAGGAPDFTEASAPAPAIDAGGGQGDDAPPPAPPA